MTGPIGLPDELAPLLVDPARAGLLTDFDGTLAPIVDDPATARAEPGAVEALATLATRFRVVAVISGRPVSFLAGTMPPAVRISGLYGLEARVDGGAMAVEGDAQRWAGVVERAAARAEAEGPDGMEVERKGLSLTLHYRSHPDREVEVRAWAQAEAAARGLALRAAKKSVELHPPVATDKGTAVRGLLDGLDAACYFADDLGDIPALDAMAAFAASGRTAVRIVVDGAETPPEVTERADLLVPGPAAVAAILAALVAATDPVAH